MDRQHAIKPAYRASGNKKDGRNRPGQMLVAAKEAVSGGGEHDSESLRSHRCYITYISTCSRSVSLPGISSPRGRISDYFQIHSQHLQTRLPSS